MEVCCGCRRCGCFLFLPAFIRTLRGGGAAARPLNVASFNMLYYADNSLWLKRRAIIPALIKFHEFDVCASQECAVTQAEWILSQLGGGWGAVFNEPKILKNGKSWAMNVVIFYNKARLRLLDSGTFWFGPDPYPPETRTFGWCEGGERQNRFCAWAKFADILAGREFFAFNLHLNSRNKNDRIKSFGLLLSEVPKIAGGTPFFIAGDFNTRESCILDKFLSSGVVFDSKKIFRTPHYGPNLRAPDSIRSRRNGNLRLWIISLYRRASAY